MSDVSDPAADGSRNITCDVTSTALGPLAVSVYTTGVGLAAGGLTVEGLPAATFTPAIGGTMGGTVLSFTGNGFTADTSVTVGGETCTVDTWQQGSVSAIGFLIYC